MNGVDPATFSNVYRFDWLNGGSNTLLHNLASKQALIEEQFAKSHDLEPGSTFNITSIDGNKLHLTVAGEYKDPNLMTGLIIPAQTLTTFSPGSKDPGIVLVSFDNTPGGRAGGAVDPAGAEVIPRAPRCRRTPSTRRAPRTS